MPRYTDDTVTKPLPRLNECESIIDALTALAPNEAAIPLYQQIGSRLAQLCYGIQDIEATLRGSVGTQDGGLFSRLEVLERETLKLNQKLTDLSKILREYIRDENDRRIDELKKRVDSEKEKTEREAGHRKTRAEDSTERWILIEIVKPITLALLIYFATNIMPKLFALIK